MALLVLGSASARARLIALCVLVEGGLAGGEYVRQLGRGAILAQQVAHDMWGDDSLPAVVVVWVMPHLSPVPIEPLVEPRRASPVIFDVCGCS